MELEFRDIKYSVKTYFNIVGSEKTILKSLSGKFYPGQLCAILGSSGAGKTTLLHVLSGYRQKNLEGTLLVNGEERIETWFRKRSCYITQDDRLPPYMTVAEAMKMASKLKLGYYNKTIIQEILSYLGLLPVRNVQTELLSGGEKKRLSIALELIANPPVFFLDEPTSGLDDLAAKLAIKLLSRMAAEGRTVVCTVHQPSASMLRIFDRVYVVGDGCCVYQGTPQALVPFLGKNGFECPLSYNPADYIIELVDKNPENIKALCDIIKNGKCSEDKLLPLTNVEDNIEEFRTKRELALEDFQWIKLTKEKNITNNKMSYPINEFKQFTILLDRFFSQLIRNKKTLTIQLVHYLVCAILCGVCFYGNADNGAMMFNHLKFCVSVVLFFSYTRLLIPIIIYPTEIKLAKKEHFNSWYGLNAYYAATSIANLPIQFMYNVLYISITYVLFGLPLELWRFLMYVLISNLVSFATEGLGMTIGAIFHPTLGLIMGPSISSVFLGLAIYGFDFARKISKPMELLQKTSPTRVGLSSLVIISFGWNREPMYCEDAFCYFADPKVLLNYVGGTDEDIYLELGTLIGLFLAYRIMAYIALQWRFRKY